METDKLAFLDQSRDEQGRFASSAREPATADTAAPPPEEGNVPSPAQIQTAPISEPPAAKATPPDGYIPIAAILDEREKRQKYERELEELRRKFDEATKQPPQPVDPIADPEGFERHLRDRLEQQEWDLKTQFSLRFAIDKHGQDAVKAAETWVREHLQENPAFFQTVKNQPDPYDFVVRQHKRHMAISKLGDQDPEAFAHKWAEANGYVRADTQHAVSVGAPSPQPTPLPRPSLASAPAASSAAPKTPVGGGVAFSEVFRK